MFSGVLPQLILFGQAHGIQANSNPSWAAIMAGVGALVFFVIVLPIYWGIRLARRGQEIAHTERMRALELGHPLPGTVADAAGSWPPGVAIGLWVPLGVFGIAFVSGNHNNPSVWIAAALVGVAGVICGTLLTLFAPATAKPEAGAAKPAIDREAYEDLAQRR
jgi:protein-S-isoprenylcysteine O-methyltransferase Ste14